MENLKMKNTQLTYGAFRGPKYLLTGPTGSGKTTFVSKLVNPKAVSIITQMVGQGSSTLKPKTFVISAEVDFENCIRICAKPNSQPLNRHDYDEVIMETFSLLAKQAAKENVRVVETAENLLMKGFIKGENYVSFLGLLEDEGYEWIQETAAIIDEVQRDELRDLYDVAHARLEDPESKKAKSKSMDSIDAKLVDVFCDYLDGTVHQFSGKDIGYKLAEQYNKINNLFTTLAQDFFDSSDVTQDGYYTIDFPLSNFMDEEKIEKRNAFFSNNANEENVSIEVLYEDIIVYVGINMGLVKGLGSTAEQFHNRNGFMEFGLIDTMGAFHKYGDKQDVKHYFEQLTRENDYDGVVLLTPLYLGANEKKFLQLSSDFFRQFPFHLDVIMISNKVDMVIDQFKKEWASKNMANDPFSDLGGFGGEVEPNLDDLKEHIDHTIKLVEQEVISNINDEGNGRASVLAHYATSFVENRIDPLGLTQLKSLPQTIIEMMKRFGRAKKSSHKIKIEFDPTYGSDIGIRINSPSLESGMQKVLDPVMFHNIMQNCRANVGKIPHGNSFNALILRLSSGEGHHVILDQRFVNVHSFDVNFPGTIKNSITKSKDDLKNILRQCIKFEGVINLTPDVEKALFLRFLSRINTKNITASLVYEQTFRPVLTKPYYAFGAKFQSYINNVKVKLTNANQCSWYVLAVEKEVHRAFKSMLDTDVLYKK
ncbi:hypothetical protein [Psychrobacillus sp. FSL H8-0487]|uniref:hypothetical protein n=1 Tax=Psychrobacillus sp. FSL H8-0487 TaxID=2921391 RepID=UPI0030F74D94